MPTRHSFSVKKYNGTTQGLLQELLKMMKNFPIEGSVPSECDDHGRSIRPTTGATGSLHMISSSWWHVAEEDTVQSTDIDA